MSRSERVTAKQAAARWGISESTARRTLANVTAVDRELASGAMVYEWRTAQAARSALPGKGRRTDISIRKKGHGVIRLPFSITINPLTKSVVVTIHSNKGGVGKTTLVHLLAYYLGILGFKVLLVDYDGQCNLSTNCGFAMAGPDKDLYTVDDILMKTRPGFAGECIEPVRWTVPGPDGTLVPDPVNERVFLVPGHPELHERETEVAKPDARFRLREGLVGVKDDFHIVLVDAPPGKGFLPDSAWAASDAVFSITQLYYNEIEGAQKSRNRLLQYRESLGVPNLDMVGVIINEHQGRTEQDATLGIIIKSFGEDRVWVDQSLPSREYIRQLITRSDHMSFGGLGTPGSPVGRPSYRVELDWVMCRMLSRFLPAIGFEIPTDVNKVLAAAKEASHA